MADKKHFDLLVRLVNALSREELKVIKAFVTALDLTDKKDSLSIKLIEFLRGKNDATWDQAKKKIGILSNNHGNTSKQFPQLYTNKIN